MTYTEKILEEFDLLTRDQYELDLEYEEAKVWLKNNPHLFTGGVYDEPMLTLDRDKIRAFLATKITQAVAEERERYTEDINFLKKLHSMELDALSLKRLEDFMEWADNRRHTPISP